MLIEFSTENFLSFHERVTLSLRVAPELDEGDGLLESTFDAPGGVRLLKSALVYGPNASGKSNLIGALRFARSFVLGSAQMQVGDAIDATPFLLDAAAAKKPSAFEIVWIDGRERYRYAFSVDGSRVVSESLGATPESSDVEAVLFSRDESAIHVEAPFAEGHGLEPKTRENALFLSVVAQFNGPRAVRAVQWFRGRLLIASGLADATLLPMTIGQLSDESTKARILRLVREADLGIIALTPKELPPEKIPAPLRSLARLSRLGETLSARHRSFDPSGAAVGDVEIDWTAESEGTRKFISLAGPLLKAIEDGATFFLDELDARLHPRLTRALVSLFQTEANPNGAQLVATTHDTNLLDPRMIRRDQVWFTEKNERGATKLYSLAEFDLPPDARYQRDYLLGKYGAVPKIGELLEPK